MFDDHLQRFAINHHKLPGPQRWIVTANWSALKAIKTTIVREIHSCFATSYQIAVLKLVGDSVIWSKSPILYLHEDHRNRNQRFPDWPSFVVEVQAQDLLLRIRFKTMLRPLLAWLLPAFDFELPPTRSEGPWSTCYIKVLLQAPYT